MLLQLKLGVDVHTLVQDTDYFHNTLGPTLVKYEVATLWKFSITCCDKITSTADLWMLGKLGKAMIQLQEIVIPSFAAFLIPSG